MRSIVRVSEGLKVLGEEKYNGSKCKCINRELTLVVSDICYYTVVE